MRQIQFGARFTFFAPRTQEHGEEYTSDSPVFKGKRVSFQTRIAVSGGSPYASGATRLLYVSFINGEGCCAWVPLPSSPSIGAKSPSRCAGLNRHEAGNARVLRERSSEPLGPEFCVVHREVYGEA